MAYVDRLTDRVSVEDSQPKVEVIREPSWLEFVWLMMKVWWRHRGGRKCSPSCQCGDYM